ncbi:Mdl1 homolog [Talaromyces pinophilus]|uniref:ABC multidrug transporter MDR2 n=1 Tax=Talaromyces pinophilus TaxID=128442 RepID=A0A6N4SLZ3_TALPI|nr:Mdl1 homolog [Talaromyces pinophilus]
MRSSKLLAAFGSRAAETGPVRSIVAGSYRTLQITPSQASTNFRNAHQLRSFASKSAPDASLLRASINNSPNYKATARSSVLSQIRCLSVSQKLNNAQPPAPQAQKDNRDVTPVNENKDEGFELSEKAAQAAQINLTAKLGRDGKEKGKKPGFNEIWRLLKIARPEAKSLGLAFFFLLISSSITMSIPFSIGKIMDLATKGEEAEGVFGMSMPMFYGALAGIICVGAAANYGRIIILRIVGERVVARQRSKLFRRTFVQDAEFFDANRVGDLISRLSSDTLIVGKSITQNLSDGLRSIVSCTAGFGAMAYVSLKLSSVLALLLPPIGVAAFFYGRTIRNLSRKIQKNLGTLTKIAEERLGNVKTSQAFAAEVSEVGRYNNQVKKIFELGRKESLISASFFSSTGLMGNMTILILLYVGGGLVQSGGITLGELTSFLMYTVYAGSSLFGLSNFYSEIMKGVGAASRLFELQDREPKISPTKGDAVKSARGPIRFENVTFSYPTRPAVSIFKDLDFEIPQGSNVAIVGPSGGGKSTIASLLLRFYNPVSGRILINGKDITQMNAKALRRKIGVVSQEPVLFSGTIAENIAYGVPGATKAEIVAAARQANCQFISDFPSGLETNVGPRGAQLSGGQKQRIAIARALIKNPDILILDEATSALDAESETLVNSALAALLRGNNTTISIAHRLSTIKRSDTIIVLGNDGRVAEIGSYQDLSTRPDGAFTRLMEWQMTGGDVAPPPTNPRNISFEEQMEELEREQSEESEIEPDEAEEAEHEDEKLPQRRVGRDL